MRPELGISMRTSVQYGDGSSATIICGSRMMARDDQPLLLAAAELVRNLFKSSTGKSFVLRSLTCSSASSAMVSLRTAST